MGARGLETRSEKQRKQNVPPWSVRRETVDRWPLAHGGEGDRWLRSAATGSRRR